MARSVKRTLVALSVLMLAVALVLPSGALAVTKWSKSPVSPLINGGVHSKARFTQLLTTNTKVRSAVKAVIKADKYPSWVFGAAVAQAKLGHISSDSLAPGQGIGAMAFGPVTTEIDKDTVWVGKGHLPYYYVVASKTATEGAFLVTRAYKVCLAKTCSNPFVLALPVVRKPITFQLYVETREPLLTVVAPGPRIGGIEVTGTVGSVPIDVTTTNTAATFLGSFAVGTPIHLGQAPNVNWTPANPVSGMWDLVMPSSDTTVTFVDEFNTPQ
jgi:hypothetical protein